MFVKFSLFIQLLGNIVIKFIFEYERRKTVEWTGSANDRNVT